MEDDLNNRASMQKNLSPAILEEVKDQLDETN